MQNKVIKLFVVFVVLFSLKGFSQTTEKSEHPLLDKYYPQAQQHIDTNKTIANRIKPVNETKPAPAATSISAMKMKPVVTAVMLPADTASAAPPVSTATVPAVTTASSDLTTAPSINTISSATNTPSFNKQDTVVTAPIPPSQPKVQPRPAPTEPYRDTRLGSSSPQYDTWEKNNNGAGSVTTGSK